MARRSSVRHNFDKFFFYSSAYIQRFSDAKIARRTINNWLVGRCGGLPDKESVKRCSLFLLLIDLRSVVSHGDVHACTGEDSAPLPQAVR